MCSLSSLKSRNPIVCTQETVSVTRNVSDSPFLGPNHIAGTERCSHPATHPITNTSKSTTTESDELASYNESSSSNAINVIANNLETDIGCGNEGLDLRRKKLDDCSKESYSESNANKSITPSRTISSHRLQEIDVPVRRMSTSIFSRKDVENVVLETQRVSLQIQGMTCTGCEKRLSRALASITEVSVVRISLLRAQAEFTLQPSHSIDAENIASTLQRMTGFICTKIIHTGEELDLIVDGNAQAYVDRPWPSSIIDLRAVDSNRIRINYLPKSIGARDLLSDPFFAGANLAPPSAPRLTASSRAHLRRSFCLTLFSCICTIPVLVFAWAPLPEHEILYGAMSLILATLVQGLVGGPFYISAAKTLLFSRMVDMDLLIALSTTTAYVYSIVAYTYLTFGKSLITGQFFETSTLLITLIMVGRTVSEYATQKAVESIAIEALQINTALIVDEITGEREIDARLLEHNDIFKVLPEKSIVTDGIIMTGESEVDESFITGEAAVVHKVPGDTVVAGTMNYSGTLRVRATRLPYENTIKIIGAMVDEAKSSQPQVQELADRAASYFVPAILGLTVVVFVTWVAVEKIVQKKGMATACITGMTYAISVLIISCPCAIGLAVPMVVVIAGGVGARHGLIFKNVETIDMARKITHVIFDKTGTLTQGKLEVMKEVYMNAGSSYVPSLVLGLTKNSTHPVSTAIATHLTTARIEALAIEQIVSHPGQGIEARWNGCSLRAGNPYWLTVQDHAQVAELLSCGLTIFCVTLNSSLIAVYGLRDPPRPDALSTITALRSRGIEISLLSGDNESSVQAMASQLGISPSNVLARCTPAQKQAYVSSQLSSTPRAGQGENVVLFCGDGTNDAPSLARASIGVHMNCGTEIAGSAADAVLMRPCLRGILTLMDLSKAFHRRVLFNFVWCFVYNLFAVLLAAGAFMSVGRGQIRIRPEFAGLGELVSVLPVVAVAVGLKFKTF